jgi:hypothetical protein
LFLGKRLSFKFKVSSFSQSREGAKKTQEISQQPKAIRQ